MKSKPIYKITRRQSSALYYPDQQLKQNVLPRGARFYHVGQECRLQELENMKPDHVCFHALITQCLPTLELFTNTTHPHFLLPTLAIYQKLLPSIAKYSHFKSMFHWLTVVEQCFNPSSIDILKV